MAISITTLSGGNTPADGSDPRTFPAIWNATASDLENEILPNGVSSPSDGEILAYDSAGSEWVNQALTSAQLPAGSVLQIVRATDTADRTTTSTTLVDANISVTITPQSASNAIIVLWSGSAAPTPAIGGSARINIAITDSSNNLISGAEDGLLGLLSGGDNVYHRPFIIGYATPATTSATTYKLRFARAGTNTAVARILNTDVTGQMYAIEVAG